MIGTTIPTAVGYCAGEVVSLIKPFREHKSKEEIVWGPSDANSLANAKNFLQEALDGGPYTGTSKESSLMPADEKRANTARIGFQILLQMVTPPIDLEILEKKLSSYIRIIGKMEQWELPNEDEQRIVDEVDKFFRHLISYTSSEVYDAVFGNDNAQPF